MTSKTTVRNLKPAGFPKSERMVSTKLIEELFTSGQSKSLTAFPLRAVFLLSPGTPAVQVLISVPKRKLRHAVDRNRVKRQIREAYRRCRQPLAEAVPDGQCLLLAFVWMSDRPASSSSVDRSVRKLVSRITEKQ